MDNKVRLTDEQIETIVSILTKQCDRIEERNQKSTVEYPDLYDELYYHIIDPEGRLSENEKAEEERKVLANMPACFPAALRYVMTRFGFTQEALAFESKVSESTIGRYRNGKVKSFSEKNVVALCVAMHLPPWLSFALIAKAGFSLAATREQQAYLMVLSCMYMRSVDEVNGYLRERGSDLLSQVAA